MTTSAQRLCPVPTYYKQVYDCVCACLGGGGGVVGVRDQVAYTAPRTRVKAKRVRIRAELGLRGVRAKTRARFRALGESLT